MGFFCHHVRRRRSQSSNQATVADVAASYMRVELNARKNQSILSCKDAYTSAIPGHPIKHRAGLALAPIGCPPLNPGLINNLNCRLLLAWLTEGVTLSGRVRVRASKFSKRRQSRKNPRHHIDLVTGNKIYLGSNWP